MSQYQYYSVGLLSNYDRFYDHQRMVVGPKKKTFKEHKRQERKMRKGNLNSNDITIAGISV